MLQLVPSAAVVRFLQVPLYFGSELKCLRAAGVPLELDREAIRLYFQFRHIPEPFSAYRAIRKLAPGSWMRYYVLMLSRPTALERYFDLNYPSCLPWPLRSFHPLGMPAANSASL